MSYIVTARKWRPQLFSDVIAQKHVTETLKNAIKSSRVGHAYLFSGPRGVGKTTVARIFAKALNCVNGPAEEPCNTCENCMNIQAGTSLDIQELDGASNNSVEDVRNLIASVGYHASRCRYKMYIIDEVHMLSQSAFNALLKTLEEPPPNVIFVFATTEPHKIPPTILSRCQRFDFHRLSITEIAGKLHKIAKSDNITIDEGAMLQIAQRAGGAMRDAESILEQLKSSHGESVTVEDVNEVLGIADRGVFFRIIKRCHEKDAFGAIELFRTYYDGGGDLKEFVEGLLSHLRDLLYARYKNGIDHVMLADEMKSEIQIQSKWFDQGDLVRMIGIVTDVETSLGYAVLPVLRIEVALARLASLETTVQLKDLFERLGGEPVEMKHEVTVTASEPDGRKAARATAHSPAEADAQAVSITESGQEEVTEETAPLTVAPDIESITTSWGRIVDRVGHHKPHIRPSLTVAAPDSFRDGILALVFQAEHEFHCKTIESYSETIDEIIGAILGTKVTIRCGVKRRDTDAVSETVHEKKNSELDDLISREPKIKEILERFDGEITDTWRE